jgi:hypothetical protein
MRRQTVFRGGISARRCCFRCVPNGSKRVPMCTGRGMKCTADPHRSSALARRVEDVGGDPLTPRSRGTHCGAIYLFGSGAGRSDQGKGCGCGTKDEKYSNADNKSRAIADDCVSIHQNSTSRRGRSGKAGAESWWDSPGFPAVPHFCAGTGAQSHGRDDE